jgi:hypothetical protein
MWMQPRIIQTADSVDINTVGNYTLRYNAVDAADNAATVVTRTVKVVSPAVMVGIQNLTFEISGANAIVVSWGLPGFLVERRIRNSCSRNSGDL